MRKFKLFVDYDKEENWLNSMAKKGYALEKVSFGYKFRSTEPQDTTIKIDCRPFRNKKDFADYCTLFEDSGWKHICGHKHSNTQYFKKIDGNSDDNIFSDKMSKAARYARLSKLWINLAAGNLGILVALSAIHAIDLKAIINPKLLYLTSGLWERQGPEFWDAFWFETPFAVVRGLLFLSPIVLTILCFTFAYMANRLNRKEKCND